MSILSNFKGWQNLWKTGLLSKTQEVSMTDEIPLIAIPDVHGHLEILERLIEELDRRGLLKGRRLGFLGDYVDRGPDSKGTIELICSLVDEGHLAIAGNHDILLARILDTENPDWQTFVTLWKAGYEDNLLVSYGVEVPNRWPMEHWEQAALDLKEAMPASHQEFLRNLPWFIETDSLILVHAGLDSRRDWPSQREILAERKTNGNDPPQVFSRGFAWQVDHRAAPKCLVTGHVSLPEPMIDSHRARIHCGVDHGGPLVAWVSDTGEIVKAHPRSQ